MLAAIPKHLKHMIFPTIESPTPADILQGNITNFKAMTPSQQTQCKNRAKTLKFDKTKLLKALKSEYDDIYAQLCSAKYPTIQAP